MWHFGSGLQAEYSAGLKWCEIIRGDSASGECGVCLVYYSNHFRWNIGAKLTFRKVKQKTKLFSRQLTLAMLSSLLAVTSLVLPRQPRSQGPLSTRSRQRTLGTRLFLRKVSFQRSSLNEELVLESDPEDMEDESPCDLPVIVYMGPAPARAPPRSICSFYGD